MRGTRRAGIDGAATKIERIDEDSAQWLEELRKQTDEATLTVGQLAARLGVQRRVVMLAADRSGAPVVKRGFNGTHYRLRDKARIAACIGQVKDALGHGSTGVL